MRKANSGLIAALALLAAAGVGVAQAQEMTPDQQRSIFMRVTRDQMTMAPQPSYWAPQIGADVPQDIELFDMPRTVAAPTALRSARYTVVNGEVVIVDPSSRRVLYVIEND